MALGRAWVTLVSSALTACHGISTHLLVAFWIGGERGYQEEDQTLHGFSSHLVVFGLVVHPQEAKVIMNGAWDAPGITGFDLAFDGYRPLDRQ